jgi:hypothetical protein
MLPAVDPAVDPAFADLVERTAADLKGPVLVLTADADLPEPVERPVSTLVVARDPAALRRLATRLGQQPWSRVVALLLAESPGVVPLAVRPGWASLAGLDARTTPAGGAVTIARFSSRVPTHEVLAALARACALPVTAGNDGVFTALAPGASVPPADVTAATSYDAEAKTPAEVWVGGDPDLELEESPVTGRGPVVVAETGDLAVGPVDEAVFNPHGFRQAWSEGVTDLDPARPLTSGLVRDLRDRQAVRVSWPADPRTVTGLAMSGVPLVADPPPEETRAALGSAVVEALTAPVDLDDPLRREEHSVRLRRAALTDHSTLAWRGRLAARAGARHAAYPSVSVVLATRRPDLLDFAVGQVAKQRLALPGAEVELVLAAHGWSPDAGRVAELLGGRAHQVLSFAPDAIFGDVLRAATDAASGDVVVKMDDDDWYGPDVLGDLLLARRYSGATLVGMPAEFVYLQPIDTTVRRRGDSEEFGTFTAGGTTMIDRSVLRGIGGFRRVSAHVDLQLFGSVLAAGGTIYRTHGLGYALRRTASGHTWETGLGYFLSRKSLVHQWRGFRPSQLLEHDAWEAPR